MMTYKKIFRGSRKQSKAAERTLGKYFLRAVMAGFFIVVAMIFSNVVGNTFQSTDPAWGKLLGGIVFAIAVLLIVLSVQSFSPETILLWHLGPMTKSLLGTGWKSMAGKLHRKLCRMPDSLRNFRTGRCFRYCRLLRRIYWK